MINNTIMSSMTYHKLRHQNINTKWRNINKAWSELMMVLCLKLVYRFSYTSMPCSDPFECSTFFKHLESKMIALFGYFMLSIVPFLLQNIIIFFLLRNKTDMFRFFKLRIFIGVENKYCKCEISVSENNFLRENM